jgi:hypothetical protein
VGEDERRKSRRPRSEPGKTRSYEIERTASDWGGASAERAQTLVLLCCLLRTSYRREVYTTAAAGLADWSEFDAEAERLSTEVSGISREDLTMVIEGSTFEISKTEHRRLHKKASDFARWGRRGGDAPPSPRASSPR